MSADNEFVSFDEALRMLRLSPDDLTKMVSTGKIQAIREADQVKFTRAEISKLSFDTKTIQIQVSASDSDAGDKPIEDGIKKLSEDRNVIRIDDAGLKGYLKSNPFYSKDFYVFGHERPTVPAFILSKDNPFTSVFRHQIQMLRESGTLQQLAFVWVGKLRKTGQGSDTMVLGGGQVVILNHVVFYFCFNSVTLPHFTRSCNWH